MLVEQFIYQLQARRSKENLNLKLKVKKDTLLDRANNT